MKKPWSVPYLVPLFGAYLVKKIWPFSGIVARAGLVAAVFVGIFLFPAQAHAARTITSATLNAVSSVTVAPGATITAAVNVTTTGTGTAARWRSTGWRIAAAPGAVTCVNHANHDSAGAYSETFSITAPATSGTYNAYFIAYNNDSCSSGASATRTMTGAVSVENPVPTTTSISPASKNVGDGAFTMTVNGTNFVSGSVVQFAGLSRITTYVSATQLTAAIPASDMMAAGTFDITVFNPALGGGTSNVQAFTVTTAFPTVTTNAASGITTENNGASWAATLNGIVSSNGTSTDVSFEWGLTTAYEETPVTATQSPLAVGAVNAAVSADLIGLIGPNCNTLFHYRVKATNGAGTSYGSDGTFTTVGCPLAPFSATDCAAARFGSNLVCTANDVNLTGITVAPGSVSSCVSGMPVTLDIDMTVNFATPDRWDVGIFIANDGKLPTQLPANGGASSCSVDILPITLPTYGYKFPDLDGEPMGTSDTCGDGNSAINGGTGSGVKRMTNVTLPCYATPASDGKLFVPFVVSWDNQKSPIGGVCTSNQYPVPNTTSKCNAPLSSVPIEVVVLPKISKTHSGATFNPPTAPITYTITVFNDSGGTLQASFFKDPIVANLAVTGLICTPANGATCPIANNTVADMQGPTGIPIPSANLPNNSSLIFTVTGTLSGSIGTTIDNTATVSIGLNTNSSTDSVTLGSASASKSFSPAAITEDNNSLMTITFTNPTAFDVTGVSFIDTYPSGLVNAASPNVSTTCGGSVTAIAGGLTFSGGTIPASGSCTVSVYVTSATANNYINSVSFLPGSLGSASATLTVNAITVGAFDAGEIGTWDRNFPDAPVIPHIYTKLAGTGFSLELAVLKSDGTRLTSYSKTVVVELLDSSVNSVFDPTTNCDSGWVSLAPPVSFSADFAPSNPNKGVTLPVAFPSVPKAYRDVRVRVTEGTKIGCSTDRFAIRPSAVTLWTDADSARPSATANPTTRPPIAAGTPFTLYATTTAGTNYNGTLTLDSHTYTGNYTFLTAQITSQDTQQSGGGTVGTLTPATLTANPSPWPSGNASYSEVGYLYLGAGAYRDDTYTSISGDAASGDCIAYDPQAPTNTGYLSDVPINGKYGCSVGNKTAVSLGRFIPDHFDTAVIYDSGTKVFMPCPSGLACPSSGDLYYPWSSADAAWSYADAVARTAAAGFVASDVGKIARQLDDNTFWELTAITPTWSLAIFGKGFVYSGQPFRVQVTAKNAGGNTTQNYQGAFAKAVTLSATNGGAVIATGGAGEPTLASAAVTGFSSGVGVASPIFTFATALTAPTNIFMRADEPLGWDGVTSLRASSVEGGVKVVSGRVKIANAYGSELLPLSMTATVQYYNAAGNWVTSTTDGITTFNTNKTPGGDLVPVIVKEPLALANINVAGAGAVTVAGGVKTFTLTAPGITGSADISLNAPSYLLPSRSGRATFGVYKGNNQFIYLREMY